MLEGLTQSVRGYGRPAIPARLIAWLLSHLSLRGKRQARLQPVTSHGDDSRTRLMLNPEFRAAFDAANSRIREMEFRFVEETDQNAQALLEIYCTLAHNAKYNDFNTH